MSDDNDYQQLIDRAKEALNDLEGLASIDPDIEDLLGQAEENVRDAIKKAEERV